MSQDSVNVFQNPVDSMRVALEDVTSEKVLNLMDFTESLSALWNVVHLEYIFFVCISYYILVTRIPQIKTNTEGRRNLAIAVLTVFWGIVGHYWRGTPVFSLIVTGLAVNAAYEYIFKQIFKRLDKIGIKLPHWYVDEVKEEKHRDIAGVEQARTEKPQI